MATSSDHLDFVCSLDICIDASSIVIGELVLFRSESYTDSFSVCSACFHSFWSCLLERVTRNQVVAFVFVSFEVFRGEIFVASAIERWAGLEPEYVDPECCVVDISLCGGEAWCESEWVLGVVGAQGGTVVAEAVVRPPGFNILILARKQQRAGTPTRPRTLAVQRLGGVSLDGTGGGVDGVFGYSSAEPVLKVAVVNTWSAGRGRADGVFTGGVLEGMNERCKQTSLSSTLCRV